MMSLQISLSSLMWLSEHGDGGTPYLSMTQVEIPVFVQCRGAMSLGLRVALSLAGRLATPWHSNLALSCWATEMPSVGIGLGSETSWCFFWRCNLLWRVPMWRGRTIGDPGQGKVGEKRWRRRSKGLPTGGGGAGQGWIDCLQLITSHLLHLATLSPLPSPSTPIY